MPVGCFLSLIQQLHLDEAAILLYFVKVGTATIAEALQ